jgi:hypothetical protein
VVVGRDPAVALDATAEALVHDDLLAVSPVIGADRLHQTAALTLSVARTLAVDMARVETERAVIAMSTTADRRTDEGPAMPAFELFDSRASRVQTLGRWRSSLTFRAS